ncbi:hypothetical protein [Breoghania sp.]|uniref:hypothetical protein n=1 Tax=Breoghania sp. TaxID=2065378 RepID=UPI00261CB304|nr:hypothetical protein [Breoghania sp.]MDJ0930710.1 hypothetical protein [Breoghania sp.]
MSALSLLSRHPDCARSHINISGAAHATTFAIALRSLQRQAICRDPGWRRGRYTDLLDLRNGMAMARMLGTLSYRSADEFQLRFGRDSAGEWDTWEQTGEFCDPEFMIESYLRHQANGFVDSYDPNLLSLSQSGA